MKISILTPDFSNNCFGRSWLLAKLLQVNFEVEIIGPAFENRIWKPLREECDFPIKIVKGYHNGRFEFKKMLNLVSGDVIYASKPLVASFGVGLVKKKLSKKPLLLDIDDWELTAITPYYNLLSWPKKIHDFLLSVGNWRSFHYAIILDKLIQLSDAITTSGPLLHKKYDGKIIWHTRDTKLFDPGKYDSKQLKKFYLPDLTDNRTVVSFIGTPRPHKGLDDLLEAFKFLKNENLLLMIVGMSNDSYCNHIRNHIENSSLKQYTIVFPEQPFEKLPEYLSITDIIIIPQRATSTSWGQVPAKLFDAMAMAKPIISTDVPGIHEIISDCGWIVPSEDPEILADTIRYIIQKPNEANQKAENARQRVFSHFSWESASCHLQKVITNLTKMNNK